VYFVKIRTIEGGPSPQTVTAEIQRRRASQAQMRDWLNGKSALLADYPQRIRRAAERVLAGGAKEPARR